MNYGWSELRSDECPDMARLVKSKLLNLGQMVKQLGRTELNFLNNLLLISTNSTN